MKIKNWIRNALVFLSVVFIVCAFTTCAVFRSQRGTLLHNDQGSGGTIKNIVIFIGDGMGPVHEDAWRDSKGEPLVWDDFDYHAKVYTGSLSTTIAAHVPTDSAAAATAIATGEKTANGSIGTDGMGNEFENIMKFAKDKGRATGVLTSDSLSGATPACFSAHADNRSMEEVIVLSQARSGIDLLMGANTAVFSKNIDDFTARGYSYCKNLSETRQAEGRIIGLFSQVTPEGGGSDETLQKMTIFALNYLSSSDKGFVLMIEGAKIDWASHSGNLGNMLSEFKAFEECVRLVCDWAKENKDTLIIVTADHETGGLILNSNAEYQFSTGGHTTSDVNCHISWPLDHSPFDAYSDGERIDNTDIFKIMYSALGMDITQKNKQKTL